MRTTLCGWGLRAGLIACLMASACAIRAGARSSARRPPTAAIPPQTIVAIGDSITRGAWDTYTDGGWVTRLGRRLVAAYPGTPFVVRNAGVDGDTTAGLLARLVHDALAPRPQLVIIAIGTNDFDIGVPAARFATQLRTLVTRLRAGPRPPVVILSSMLPIAAQTPARLDAERAYNDVIRYTAAALHVGYLDLFDIWLALGDNLMNTLRHDTEHPNPIGYELLAGTTAAYLQAAYLDTHGRVVAPAQPPTCSPALCQP